MALEIPWVMSPIGMNTSVVEHGKNGFLCQSPQEWKSTLIELLENESFRKEIGKAGYQTVKEHYSVEANRADYLKILNA